MTAEVNGLERLPGLTVGKDLIVDGVKLVITSILQKIEQNNDGSYSFTFYVSTENLNPGPSKEMN
jgi:hypothetical protein